MGIALIIALVLSMDAFGVGMAYGLKKIRIPFISMIIISSCTAFALGISMLFGHLLSAHLTFVSPRVLGAAILIVIGLFQLVQVIINTAGSEQGIPVMSPVSSKARSDSYEMLFKININMFGLIIQVLRTPGAADIDKSGTISPGESVLLGIALALDAFASGMAVSMTGFPYYIIVLVAGMTSLMIWAGQMLMGKIPVKTLCKIKYLPSMILIIIGVLKIV